MMPIMDTCIFFGGGHLTRANEPIRFWIMEIFYGGVGAYFLLLGVVIILGMLVQFVKGDKENS